MRAVVCRAVDGCRRTVEGNCMRCGKHSGEGCASKPWTWCQMRTAYVCPPAACLPYMDVMKPPRRLVIPTRSNWSTIALPFDSLVRHEVLGAGPYLCVRLHVVVRVGGCTCG